MKTEQPSWRSTCPAFRVVTSAVLKYNSLNIYCVMPPTGARRNMHAERLKSDLTSEDVSSKCVSLSSATVRLRFCPFF